MADNINLRLKKTNEIKGEVRDISLRIDENFYFEFILPNLEEFDNILDTCDSFLKNIESQKDLSVNKIIDFEKKTTPKLIQAQEKITELKEAVDTFNLIETDFLVSWKKLRPYFLCN